MVVGLRTAKAVRAVRFRRVASDAFDFARQVASVACECNTVVHCGSDRHPVVRVAVFRMVDSQHKCLFMRGRDRLHSDLHVPFPGRGRQWRFA